MAEKTIWKDNVGHMFLSDDTGCFWLFPTDFLCNKRLCVTSPWFSHEGETWRLVKMPDNVNNESISFFVWRKACRSSISYKYTLKLSLKTLDRYETPINSREVTIDSEFGYEFVDFCSLSNLQYYLLSLCGLTKLFFEIHKNVPAALDSVPSITTAPEEENSKSECEEYDKAERPELKGIERLAENMKHLLLSGENSDLVLKADVREFRVHKAILAARSPVFASMFQHDMTEKNSGMVDIPDCTAESFDVFLLYLYTGSADTVSPKNVFNLYYAADKYRVDDLKEECIWYMIDIISLETFCDVVALSLRHGESKLQKEATRFFRENIKEIIKTVHWQKYMAENPTQANELLIKALNP